MECAMQFLTTKILFKVSFPMTVQFKKNLILNFQTSVIQLATHIMHTFDTGAPHWWLHREMREMICVL
jgi:hypothetical protein